MMNTIKPTQTKPLTSIVLADAALVAAACLIPAVSHLVALPIYWLNPMLALLLAGILIGKDWRNTLLLAVLMPLASCLIAGMPAAPKMVCMIAELAVVALTFHAFEKRSFSKMGVLTAVLLSVVAGRVVYYALKALIIAPVIGTAWWMQLLAVLLWGGLFAVAYKRIK
jgi:hypothetical protein